MILSFETQEHKRCVVAKDKDDRYIVYRFGTESKIELEYPPMNPASWQKMKYYRYMRPGFELNYLNFVRGNYRYVLYETYSDEAEEGDEWEVGVKVLDLNDKFLSRQSAKVSTQTGSLIDLQWNELIGKRQEYSNE